MANLRSNREHVRVCDHRHSGNVSSEITLMQFSEASDSGTSGKIITRTIKVERAPVRLNADIRKRVRLLNLFTII